MDELLLEMFRVSSARGCDAQSLCSFLCLIPTERFSLILNPCLSSILRDVVWARDVWKLVMGRWVKAPA